MADPIQYIIKSTVERRRSRGRRELYWLKNVQDWTGYRDDTNILHAVTTSIKYNVIRFKPFNIV